MKLSSYSHTHHVVSQEQFDTFIEGLLGKLEGEKKAALQKAMSTEQWQQVRQSNYLRHNLLNGGLSGPFTEYYATFNPEWQVDFWGGRVQPLETAFLTGHALPRAYQATVLKTQEVLAAKVKDFHKPDVAIASLACGTMYDVLGARYEILRGISFSGYDVDIDSLKLAQEKGASLKLLPEQIKVHQLDVVSTPLPEKQFDIIVCNGFSFYIDDASLSKLMESVQKALKKNGVFLMSFLQPPSAPFTMANG